MSFISDLFSFHGNVEKADRTFLNIIEDISGLYLILISWASYPLDSQVLLSVDFANFNIYWFVVRCIDFYDN